MPPSAPGNVTASGSTGVAVLNWGAASDVGGIAWYEVHRSTVAGFTPSAATLVARPTGTTYTDSGLAAGTYYYVVIAVDRAGNIGPVSSQVAVTSLPTRRHLQSRLPPRPTMPRYPEWSP